MSQTLTSKTQVYFDQNMEHAVHAFVCDGVVAVYSCRSPGKETANEDSAAIIACGDHGAILVVADGLGGGPSGQNASRLAIESLKAAAAAGQQKETMPRTRILNGLEEANHAVRAMGIGAGTTMAVVELQGVTARPYHVGDSMILVVGQRGKIKLQTTSHSPVGFAVEAGVLGQREAMFHEDRHLISNVVGTEQMKIEIGPPIELAPRDTLLLASDGLFDNLHLSEIVSRIRKGPLEAAADRLARDSLRRMTQPDEGTPSKPDDLTFILLRRNVGRR
ncbi:MAG: protein phosphatase 2C domain-containing protein [Pirellulales bacterium]|nr:protein phosphatase 2C domain-containing protein [Pirellulales bacterium]